MKKKNEYTQRVKLAPAAELKAYVIHEYQPDMLSQGSMASVKLNVSLCLLSIAATIFVEIYTAPPTADRTFYVFVIVGVLFSCRPRDGYSVVF